MRSSKISHSRMKHSMKPGRASLATGKTSRVVWSAQQCLVTSTSLSTNNEICRQGPPVKLRSSSYYFKVRCAEFSIVGLNKDESGRWIGNFFRAVYQNATKLDNDIIPHFVYLGCMRSAMKRTYSSFHSSSGNDTI